MNHTTSNDAPQLNSPTSSSSSSALSLLDANIDEDVTLTSSNVEDVVLSSSGTNPVDIMQILSKAKKEYDKVSNFYIIIFVHCVTNAIKTTASFLESHQNDDYKIRISKSCSPTRFELAAF